jgi:hypothetical protein
LVSATGYAYPWDFLDDDGAAARAASLDIDVVAVAATYHATRVATPLHPTRRITEVPHSAAYFALRDEIWRGQRLRPREPQSWIGPHSFERARDLLTREGVSVDGWVVLTHNDDLDNASRDLLVRNAYGESYSYALCPRNDDVRDYCRTVVQEVLRGGGLRGLVLEACGPMGLDHGGSHDKVAMAQWNSIERQLLSICFCRACEVALVTLGVDPLDLSRAIREGLARGLTSMESALGEYATALAAYRVSVATTLQNDLIDAAREVDPNAALTLHVSANPWATGSFPASSTEVLTRATCAVANCWSPDDAASELSELGAMTKYLGAYLRLDREGGRVDEDLARYASLGARELHLYHLGLMSTVSAETAARLVARWNSHIGATNMDDVEESLNDR